MVVICAACSSDGATAEEGASPDSAEGSDPTADTSTDDAADAAPVVAGAPLNPFDLRAGQCFNEGAWYDEERERRIELTAAIDCAQPHNKEVYHEAEFPAPEGAPYPGEVKMTEWSTELCYSAFVDFVGLDYELSTYEIGFIQPTEATFEHPVGRHRRVTCVLYDTGNEHMVGSAEATGV